MSLMVTRGGGECVQMRRRADGGMDVRSSDTPESVLHYRAADRDAWLDGASRQEFDHLIPQE